MGIVVEYRGRLHDLSRMDAALDTVRHFCREVGWECSDYSEQVSGVVINPAERNPGIQGGRYDPKSPTRVTVNRGDTSISWDEKSVELVEGPVRGVIAKAPNDGQFPFIFDSDGWLGYFISMAPEWLAGTPYAGVQHYLWSRMATKTSFGGFEFHVGVCAILKRLRQDFLPEMKVSDDTDYFETGDLKALRSEHNIMSIFLGAAQEPAFLKMIMQAAGLPAEQVESAELLDPRTMKPKTAEAPAPKAKAAKTTVH